MKTIHLSVLAFLIYFQCGAQTVTDLESRFLGDEPEIGETGQFARELSLGETQITANQVSFSSHLKFLSRHSQSDGVAQIYRKNTDYETAFTVEDPSNLGYCIQVTRIVEGVSAVSLLNPESGQSNSLRLGLGLVRLNEDLDVGLSKPILINRRADTDNPTPENETHTFEDTALFEGFSGTQTFVLSVLDPAPEIGHTLSNFASGASKLSFGFDLDNLGELISENEDHGDHLEITIIYSTNCRITLLPADQVQVDFLGVLQSSIDLETWTDVDPQPQTPMVVSKNDLESTGVFYRSRSR